MAERRMFSKTIVDSDIFLDMPLSAQSLYFHLNIRADDDGFVNNPKRIQRTVGANEDDLKLLVAKSFIIAFDSGVIVIVHWKMHNVLRKDRANPTIYQNELAMLELSSNGIYTLKTASESAEIEEIPLCETVGCSENETLSTTCQPLDNQMSTKCQPSFNLMSAQDRLVKDSIVYNSVVDDVNIYNKKNNNDSNTYTLNKNGYGKYHNVILTTEEFNSFKASRSDWQSIIDELSEKVSTQPEKYANGHRAWLDKFAKCKKNFSPGSPSYNSEQAFGNFNIPKATKRSDTG